MKRVLGNISIQTLESEHVHILAKQKLESNSYQYTTDQWKNLPKSVESLSYCDTHFDFPRRMQFGVWEHSCIVGLIGFKDTSFVHRRATVTITIFESEQRSKGIGTAALRLLCNFCRDELNLHKLLAVTFGTNEASKRIFEKNGFEMVGKADQHFFSNGGWVGGIFWQKVLV